MNAADDLVVWLRAQLDEAERLATHDGTLVAGNWSACEVSEVRSEVVGVGRTIAHSVDPQDAEHIAANDPARTLREVEASRLLIDRYVAVRDLVARCAADYAAWAAGKSVPDVAPVASQNDPGLLAGLEFAVRARALPYADRPGYREEWRP